jgi:glycosyltransferase involved in cell wall biosynthesis
MKIALVHDWLTGMRGGEKCLEVFCELFPDADLYTLLYVKGAVSATIEKHPIKTSFIQNLPFSHRYYRYCLPLFPKAIEAFDLSEYELVLSSSHCVAKGVRTSPQTLHISYIHTPMRYIWDQYHHYFGNGRGGTLTRWIMPLVLPYLRRWDVETGQLPTYLIASSNHVAQRIQNYYHRESMVIYPPVDVGFFKPSTQDEGYYLVVSALAPYKRVDLAIEAFNRLKWPLKIIGSGQEEKRLKQIAGPTVELLGWKTENDLRSAYAACRAVVFPGEEDFGIVPLEAMACGKPVIAYGSGGVVESVIPLQNKKTVAPTGVFFYDQTPEALIEVLEYFEDQRGLFDPYQIREQVKPFDRQQFKEKVFQCVQSKFQEFKQAHHA